MVDLKRYGVADKWPRLVKLQEEVASLERRREEAQSAVVAARNSIPAARERDAESAGKAIRAGKSVPRAKAAQHEAKAHAALEDAERDLGAYQKAVEGAQQDLGQFMAQHGSAIRASLVAAVREKARRLSEHAREAATLYGAIEDARRELKHLTPPQAPVETGPPGSEEPSRLMTSTAVLGVQTVRIGGPARGDVEGMLSYLSGLQHQFEEPTKPVEVVGDDEQAPPAA